MDSVPKSFPNLMRAAEIQKKAAKAGFDWKEVEPAWEKVKEEIAEFEKEAADFSPEMEPEFGDILFALVNIARFYKIDAEEAVRKTNEKFIRRFKYVEERVMMSGRKFEDFTLEQLDEFWNEAKSKGY